jgi:hypothetical protein
MFVRESEVDWFHIQAPSEVLLPVSFEQCLPPLLMVASCMHSMHLHFAEAIVRQMGF